MIRYNRKTAIALALEFHNKLAVFKVINNYYKNLSDVWQETESSLFDKMGLKSNVTRFINKKDILFKDVDELLEELKHKGISLLTILDDNYPILLKHIFDPPPLLYYIGKIDILSKSMVGIVGTRKATSKAAVSAFQLAELIVSQNEVVVSGGARGIDSSAHKGALHADGDLVTVVVTGAGLDVVYPRENRSLFDEVSKRGLLLSENRPGTPPLQRNFPRRNRIISGLVQKLIVVQAPKKSGALISADFALENGRDVFVIPWPDAVTKGLGNRKLLAEGAFPLLTGAEIYPKQNLSSVLPISKPDEKNIALLNEMERLVLAQIGFEKKSISSISNELNLNIEKVLFITSKLELKKLIMGWPGQSYTKRFIL